VSFGCLQFPTKELTVASHDSLGEKLFRQNNNNNNNNIILYIYIACLRYYMWCRSTRAIFGNNYYGLVPYCYYYYYYMCLVHSSSWLHTWRARCEIWVLLDLIMVSPGKRQTEWLYLLHLHVGGCWFGLATVNYCGWIWEPDNNQLTTSSKPASILAWPIMTQLQWINLTWVSWCVGSFTPR
jgi:hypothetical protein